MEDFKLLKFWYSENYFKKILVLRTNYKKDFFLIFKKKNVIFYFQI